MTAPTLARILAAVSDRRTPEALHSALRGALAAHPDLPVTLDAELGLHWHGAPDGEDAGAFHAFARTVANLSGTLADLHRHAQVYGLAREFTRRDETATSLGAYSRECCRIFGLDGLGGLRLRSGALRRAPSWDAGTPRLPAFGPADVAAVRAGEPDVRAGGVLLPIGGRFRARAAFWLDAPGRAWSGSDRDLLRQLGHLIGLEYERGEALRHLQTLQALHRDLMGGQPEQAYQPLLERALATIPGAECGSLLIREGGVFRYAASVTFDETELSEVTFPVEHTRDRWYGLGEEAWHRGVPRVQSSRRLASQGVGYQYRGALVEDLLPSVAGIQANIGVPILYQGEVYAFLNIDSLTDPDAFAEDSVNLARSFGVQAALLLHEAHLRAQVQVAARTDALTGLLNRRAFTEALTRELARARRHALPLSLLVADIRAFKAVNDTHGHATGDDALVQVGAVLDRTLRATDAVFRPGPVASPGDGAADPTASQVFRWGGDEFAILLPATDRAGAQAVRERLRRAMREIRVAGRPIELNLGVAVLGAGDLTGQALLHAADADMYRDKHAGRPLGARLSGI